jgi:CRISPR/Cas system-associated exonuclease Cas4 (RecB family)
VQHLHTATNFLVFGAIDDLWQNSKEEYIVVDYKATAKAEEITELNKAWHISYKRQMEVYQWLLRQNNYKVSNTGYFVYCNGIADKEAFDQKLEFRVNLIPYEGNDSWVEKTILNIHKCLNSPEIPVANSDCDYCSYREAAEKHK